MIVIDLGFLIFEYYNCLGFSLLWDFAMFLLCSHLISQIVDFEKTLSLSLCAENCWLPTECYSYNLKSMKQHRNFKIKKLLIHPKTC